MNVKPGPATPEGFWVSSGNLIRVIHCKAVEVETLLLRERERECIPHVRMRYIRFWGTRVAPMEECIGLGF